MIPAEMISESFAPVKMVQIEKSLEPVKSEKAVEPVKVETVTESAKVTEELEKEEIKTAEQPKPEKVVVDWNKSYEDMTIEELQEAILEKMRKNGPVTEYMLGTVRENKHHGSLVSWVRSFN